MGKMNLKDTTLAIGGTPASMSKYTTTHGPHGIGPAPTIVPRDGGGMSTGTTDGNFDMGSMTKLPNNSTPTGTQDGAECAQSSFAGNGE